MERLPNRLGLGRFPNNGRCLPRGRSVELVAAGVASLVAAMGSVFGSFVISDEEFASTLGDDSADGDSDATSSVTGAGVVG